MSPYGSHTAERIGGKGRAHVLRAVFVAVAALITVKMIYLQVGRSSYYRAKADEQHQGRVTLPAKRGDISILSSNGEVSPVATDISLNLVYIDPAFIQHQVDAALQTAAGAAQVDTARANAQLSQELAADTLAKLLLPLDRVGTGEQLYPAGASDLPPDPEGKLKAVRDRILKLMSAKEASHVALLTKGEFTPELAKKIEDLHLRGIFVTQEEIYADPTLIEDLAVVANVVAPLVDTPAGGLQDRLKRRPIRYVVLKRKLPPDVSKQIQDLISKKQLVGVGLLPEHWRYYPEESLASNVVGFVNHEGRGQYGIEESYDDPQRDVTLRGVDGWVQIDRDPTGRQISVGDEITTPARDGDDVVLTIDRVVQQKMEEILKDAVVQARAEKGALLVTDPQTGRIIAMASYPTFDPNHYEDAMKLVASGPEAGSFVNKVGPLAYVDIGVDIPYEPGSVFKVLTMASGIDAGEITPDTVTYDRTGFIEVDHYIVRNSSLKAEGRMTMTNVLERSSNLGAAFVSRRLGRGLFYHYLQDFGFGQPTDIQFASEHPGWLKEPQNWADIDLVTAAFGQGIAATPVQVVTAVAAIANGGKLMRPTIISSIHHAAHDGRPAQTEVVEPRMVRQVIQPGTAAQVAKMMISVVDNGVAPKARVQGYYVAGKTGTSQISKENGGGYEKGPGSTVATLCGFAPADAPRVMVYIRVDRPLADYWGSTVAAPAFSRATGWLMKYYNIPPQR